MADDILEILRTVWVSDKGQVGRLAKRAADEIERLRRSPPQVGRGMEEMRGREAVFYLCANCSSPKACHDRKWCGSNHPDKGHVALSSSPAEEGGSAAGAAPIASKRSTRSALSADLQDVLGEIEVFLQDQHDIRDGAGGQQLPNKAMALSTALKEALGERP